VTKPYPDSYWIGRLEAVRSRLALRSRTVHTTVNGQPVEERHDPTVELQTAVNEAHQILRYLASRQQAMTPGDLRRFWSAAAGHHRALLPLVRDADREHSQQLIADAEQALRMTGDA
jgi:hypothetical protein